MKKEIKEFEGEMKGKKILVAIRGTDNYLSKEIKMTPRQKKKQFRRGSEKPIKRNLKMLIKRK